MNYAFHCSSCFFCGSIEIADSIETFCCTKCGRNIPVKNRRGFSREFQRILNNGIPTDKNGTQITAGDIVADRGSRGVVEWKIDEGFSILGITYFSDGKYYAEACGLPIRDIGNMEIIGSIYKNQELLNLHKVSES